MEFETLQTELREQVLTVSLNRPDAMNGLNQMMAAELTTLFEMLHRREDIRVVILRANGRAFCVGADLKEDVLDDGNASQIHRLYALQRGTARIFHLMRSCPQPIIGLGHGAACGGGFSMLLACDLRYAAPSLRMNAAYIKIGLSGCDMASSYLLPRLVGLSIASELLLTGKFIYANRALALGLVSDVVDEGGLVAAALETASEMLRASPLGLRMTKDALNLAIDAPSMAAAMALEDRQQIMIATTADADEAMKAFFEKRNPVFQNR